MNGRLSTAPLALLSFSCATTSGREWLETPVEPRAPVVAPRADFASSEEPTTARPRLRHTVTLGESYEAASEPAPPGAPPAVQVTVNNQIPVVISHPVGYGYGYGYVPAYSYARAPAAAPAARSTPSAPQKVGGDFPAPPDYGPRALR